VGTATAKNYSIASYNSMISATATLRGSEASPTKALQCEEALNTLIVREHVIRTKKPDPNKLASIDTMQKRSRTYRCRNPYNET